VGILLLLTKRFWSTHFA